MIQYLDVPDIMQEDDKRVWRRWGNKQLGATQALLGIENKLTFFQPPPRARRRTSALDRRSFCSTFQGSSQAETDKQCPDGRSRCQGGPASFVIPPGTSQEPERWLRCASGFTGPTGGISGAFRLVRFRQAWPLAPCTTAK